MLRVTKLASGRPRIPILVGQCWEAWSLKVAPPSGAMTSLWGSPIPQQPVPSAWLWAAVAAGQEGGKARLGNHELPGSWSPPPSLRRHPGSQQGDNFPLAAQVGLLRFRKGKGFASKSYSSWRQSSGWTPGLPCDLRSVTTAHFCQGRALSLPPEAGRWGKGQPRNSGGI